jgi:eukaryotic-like serine/threonine-protein kinase
MKAERWQQIDKLLERALELEPSQRRSFLDEACAGDEELRREVETLLVHEHRGSFLSSPAVELAAKMITHEKPESLVGQQLGSYQIASLLGRGGMGVVYKARDTHLDRFVAIKALPHELVADADRKRRFVQEAKAASALNHPNIITIHDIASDNGTDFIVMEYVQGKTLGQLIPRRGVKLNEVLKYAIQIADALAKAHAAGIIHRDLKPGNIMVNESGLVKVLDFGLAKLAEKPQGGEAESTGTLQPQTEEGMILGTASYMSPEQAAGKPVDTRSDIFSFGSVLYEMVTGQRAFQGDSKMSTLVAILNQEPKSAREISRSLPQDLEKIITRCLRKDPSRRFQHMADLKVALEELKEESDSGLLGVREDADSSGKPRRVALLRWATLAVAGVSLAVAAWFWLYRSATEKPEAVLTTVPLTTDPGREGSPSFSPDGNQVAFEWAKTGHDDNSDIYIKQIGVEDPFQLTDDPARDVNPAWSPDGRSIAFGRYLSPTRIAYIVKPQRGGTERTIAEFDVSEAVGLFFARANCAWTRDSKSLVVVGKNRAEQPDALFLVALETLEKRKLTDPPPRSTDLGSAVSPDGLALVFSRISQGFNRCDLFLLKLSEDLTPQGEPEKLTFDNRINHSPAWSADQREILFLAGTTTWIANQSLWKLATSKSVQPERLALLGSVAPGLAVSRQGNRLAYAAVRSDTNIWRVEVPATGVAPSAAVKFIASTSIENEPAYSPNGKKIAFTSHRSGSMEIWVCNSDGSHPEKLTSFGAPQTIRPRWSPDGQQVVFYSNAEGSRDIYIIGLDRRIPKQLAKNPSNDANPSWSADGKWIYFQSDRTGGRGVWKVPVDGGEAVPVLGVRGGGPVESPDGKFIYYHKDDGIWRVPASGGAQTQVIDSIHPEGGWVVVAEGIYFISKPDAKGVSYLRFKDLATRAVRTIAPIKGKPYWGLTVSPDRRTFLYAQSDESGSDLMLVENFR